jgi:hypothetical protein
MRDSLRDRQNDNTWLPHREQQGAASLSATRKGLSPFRISGKPAALDGQQSRDLLGVPTIGRGRLPSARLGVQESTVGSMRPMALIQISRAASIDRP